MLLFYVLTSVHFSKLLVFTSCWGEPSPARDDHNIPYFSRIFVLFVFTFCSNLLGIYVFVLHRAREESERYSPPRGRPVAPLLISLFFPWMRNATFITSWIPACVRPVLQGPALPLVYLPLLPWHRLSLISVVWYLAWYLFTVLHLQFFLRRRVAFSLPKEFQNHLSQLFRKILLEFWWQTLWMHRVSGGGLTPLRYWVSSCRTMGASPVIQASPPFRKDLESFFHRPHVYLTQVYF